MVRQGYVINKLLIRYTYVPCAKHTLCISSERAFSGFLAQNEQRITKYNNVLDMFSYAAHTLANTLWSERALRRVCFHIVLTVHF